jgi:hypothetical protein
MGCGAAMAACAPNPGPGGGQFGDAAAQKSGELVGQISATDWH